MIIHGMTVCVGYADRLQQTLLGWMQGLSTLTVITTPDDYHTYFVCKAAAAPHDRCVLNMYRTNAFFDGGRAFGKSNAMEECGEWRIREEDWILFFDADVKPPPAWKEIVEAHDPRPGHLYGATRARENGQPVIREREIAGYFQLFHGSDPLAKDQVPLLDTSWTHAGGYDTAFQNKWPAERRHFLPLTVTHLGEPFNWYGTGPEAKEKMDALLKGWKQYGHGRCPGERV